MMLFDLATNDQSVYYLGKIFGVVGSVLPASMFSSSEPPPIILDNMFKILNSIALTVGVLIVTYTTVVGLFATAHDGEFLGKKWGGSGGAMWIPIRTVIGIAGLFPSSGGYCAIQVVLMWIILQGVGAADTMWTTALDVIKAVGNPRSGVVSADSNTIKDQFRTMFSGLTCQYTAQTKHAPVTIQTLSDNNEVTFYCNNINSDFCNGNLAFDSGSQFFMPGTKQDSAYFQYNFGPVGSNNQGACGYVQYSNWNKVCADKGMSSLECKSAQKQADELRTLIEPAGNSLGAIAKEFARLDAEYLDFYETKPPTDPGQLMAPKADHTPVWVSNYCTTPETAKPPGIGVPAEQCCAWPGVTFPGGAMIGGCAAYKSFETKRDIYFPGEKAPDITNPSPEAVSAIYLPFGMPDLYGNNFIQVAADEYALNVVAKPLDEYIKNNPKNVGWITDAKALGWLLAGAYYMQIAKEGRSNYNAVPLLTAMVNQPVKPPMNAGNRTNIVTAATLADQIEGASQPITAVETVPVGGSVAKESSKTMGSVVSNFWNRITEKNDDPLVAVAQAGYQMMKQAQYAFIALATASAILGGVTAISPVLFGNGLVFPIAYAIYQGLNAFFGPLTLLLVSTLFSVGSILGVYVPLIPYIVFTVTAIGWFIAVIEAMVAAPLVALGIMSPSGQHEIMGKAEGSIMIIFNLFLRPTMMVIGMIAAMLLAWVVVQMINSAFKSVMFQIMDQPGFIEQVVFMCGYVFLVITALNKCFALIHMLPERVLTYIGGHAISYGEAEALQGVKGAVESAGGGIAKAGAGSGAPGQVKEVGKKAEGSSGATISTPPT